MIHIKEITLENFQTHKNTRIEFSPNFNVVVGSSRSGKSSLCRAIDFLLYNNWYEDYQRFYTDATTITAKLSDGKIITRTKSSKVNKVTIEEPSGKVQRFESFGTSYPSEVISALGVAPIDIGTKDPILANVANQDDPLFLLYTTGTDKTKVLSRLSGLHWIDFALKDLNLDRHSGTKSVQLLKATNEQLLEKLKYFQNLPAMRKQFAAEKVKLSKLKQIDMLYQRGSLLVTKTSQWKSSYQEVQRLKQIDFVTEKSRLEKIIRTTEVLQALKELMRQLEINRHSVYNIRTQLDSNIEAQKRLETQISEEESKIRICASCGQEIKSEKEECKNNQSFDHR